MIHNLVQTLRERIHAASAPREKDFSATGLQAIEIQQGGRTEFSEAEIALREADGPNYPDEDPEELSDRPAGIWNLS